MTKQLIINETYNETRVALLENGELIDHLIERGSKEKQDAPIVGNIYMGKILRVLPGMQSAFVDIGQERAAFLYVDDAYIPTLEEQREMAEKSKHIANEERHRLGNVIPDEMSTLTETVDMKFRPDVKIQDFLKEGDFIMVQVAKEPISTKGPRVTRHITFAGRHIVFMPFIEHTGVSRRIENDVERERLREVLDSIKSTGVGVIARTVAENQSYKVLKSDYNMLVKLWKEVQQISEKQKTPGLIYRDLDFVQRALRDITVDDINEIVVDSKATLKQVEKFIQRFLITMKGKLTLYTGENPIFEQYGIESELERAIGNVVYLKSGGAINVDQTEALVSIDVNTGKFVGKKTLEETILKTNLEAVKEIAYQLRLRNCGGIIIIDFIDMEKEEHRTQVYQAFLEALKKDRAKTNVLPISGLGLVEMTRKRTRDTLTRIMCDTCPYCEGSGKVKSVETVCYEIIRNVLKMIKTTHKSKISIFAHPEVSARLSEEEFVDDIELTHGKLLEIRSENNYHIEQYDIF